MRYRYSAIPWALLVLPVWLGGCRLDTEGTMAQASASHDASLDGGSVEADAAASDGSAEAAYDASVDAPSDTGLGDGASEAGDAAPEAADAALEADACEPEPDDVFCTRLGAECGPFTGVDNCGVTRSLDCGTCALPSTCGGAGTQNVCDWWWACDWTHRRRLTVTTQEALPSGYSLSIVLDHGSLVNAGLSASSGDDLRILHVQGQQIVEVDRVLDPDSSWSSGSTKLWFAAQDPVPAGGTDEYFLFVGNLAAGAPPANEAAVFHFADFFDRADSDDPGLGWITWEATGASVSIAAQSLHFSASDQNNRPAADHPFVALDGQLELRFGFDWARTGEEGWYRAHVQLGSAAAMEKPPPSTNVFSNLGVGPSLVWTGVNGGMAEHEALGYEAAGAVTQSAVVSGKASIALRASVPGRTFDLFVDGTQVADDAPFTGDMSSLDRLRLFAWQVNSVNFADSSFDWVLLRPLLPAEPVLSMDAFEQGGCP